jgi:hypothetical protein
MSGLGYFPVRCNCTCSLHSQRPFSGVPQGGLSLAHRSRSRTPLSAGLSAPTPRCAAGYPLLSLTRVYDYENGLSQINQ